MFYTLFMKTKFIIFDMIPYEHLERNVSDAAAAQGLSGDGAHRKLAAFDLLLIAGEENAK